jgi:hypothetical protein
MKNEHILPNTEVPIELRKEVYKEALRIIEETKEEKYGLCLLLPKILWGLNIDEFIEDQTNKSYKLLTTTNMFPELIGFLKNGLYADYTNQERIEFLKSVI